MLLKFQRNTLLKPLTQTTVLLKNKPCRFFFKYLPQKSG